MNEKSLPASFRSDKLIEEYPLRHVIELAASTPGQIDRSHIMEAYHEVLGWAIQDSYFAVTESMSELIESTRNQRS